MDGTQDIKQRRKMGSLYSLTGAQEYLRETKTDSWPRMCKKLVAKTRFRQKK